MVLIDFSHTHDSLAYFGALGKEPSFELCNDHINYVSIFGMCWYLRNSFFPDIHMDVSQCDSFSFFPYACIRSILKG